MHCLVTAYVTYIRLATQGRGHLNYFSLFLHFYNNLASTLGITELLINPPEVPTSFSFVFVYHDPWKHRKQTRVNQHQRAIIPIILKYQRLILVPCVIHSVPMPYGYFWRVFLAKEFHCHDGPNAYQVNAVAINLALVTVMDPAYQWLKGYFTHEPRDQKLIYPHQQDSWQ